MRCIEMVVQVADLVSGRWINRNMRCIEILAYITVFEAV